MAATGLLNVNVGFNMGALFTFPWTELYRWVPALLVVTGIVGGLKLLYRLRATAMRALAHRLGFQYAEGNSSLWFAPKDYHPIPTAFRLRGYPLNTLRRTWNVLEGERNGVRVVILDSILGLGGKGGGRYCTFIAVRTEDDPFGDKSDQEKIAHSNGWTALYRFRFWQIPWTLSIQEIQEHLDKLKT
jgi:hypothetical protein